MKLIHSMPIIIQNENIDIELIIAGSGSLDMKIEKLSKNDNYGLNFLGRINRKEVIKYIDNASLCIVPFENSIGNSTLSLVGEYVSRDKIILSTIYRGLLDDLKL